MFAFAVGPWLTAMFTVTCMVSVSVAPLLSVTFNSNLYIPCAKPVAVVIADVVLVMLPAAGPEIFLHRYAVIVPSGSVPLPVIVAVLVGSVRFWSSPAFAIGN